MIATPTLTGLIGYPVAHSISPAIHEYWMRHHAIAGEYKLFTTPPARLRQTVQRLRKKGLAGFNVTVPHKEKIIPHLDAIDDVAQRIGAVNTVQRVGDALHGTNTDAYGFLAHLHSYVGDAPDLTRVVILGAGGAARAAIVALRDAGAEEIVLMNRSPEKSQALAEEFSLRAIAWELEGRSLAHAALLVNTTSLGMHGQPPLNISLHHLPESAIVYDIVYNPRETTLLKAARNRGNSVVDGLGMLLYQAQKAFALWHGVTPAVDDGLRRHALAALQSREGI